MRRPRHCPPGTRLAGHQPATPQRRLHRSVARAARQATDLLSFNRLLLRDGYFFGTYGNELVLFESIGPFRWKVTPHKLPLLQKTFARFIDEDSDFASGSIAFKTLAARQRWIGLVELKEDLPEDLLRAAKGAFHLLPVADITRAVRRTFDHVPPLDGAARHKLFLKLLYDAVAERQPKDAA
jgi:hypothetical protein